MISKIPKTPQQQGFSGFFFCSDNDLITEKRLVSREGVTELLKAQDQMQWVQRMNSIRDWATEIVNNDLIYA